MESGDCDDTDDTIRPGAEEACNGLDDDCDMSLDEGLVPRASYFRDADGDNFGDPADSVEACAAPPGFVDTGDDCAPAVSAIYPGASEACNGIDEDCDTGIDEGSLSLIGAEQTVGTGKSFLDVESDGSTYWVAWVSGGMPTLMHLSSTGDEIGSSVAWPATSTVWTVALAVVDTAAGTRAVVAWRDGSSVFAAIVDTSAPSETPPITLGTAEGDQSLVAAQAVGERVLVAWQSSRNLRARQVDPVGARTQGLLMDEPVSTMGGMYFQGPSLADSATAGEAWVAFPALRSGDTAEAVYVARISTGASPTWSGILDRSAPYPDLFLAILGPPSDVALPVLIGGTSGACIERLSTAGSPSFDGSCEPTAGNLTFGLRRRGGVLTGLLAHSGDRIALVDLPDAPGTEGGSFVNLSSTPAVTGNLALSNDVAGMAVYAVGESEPYDLIAQPIGCE